MRRIDLLSTLIYPISEGEKISVTTHKFWEEMSFKAQVALSLSEEFIHLG